MLNRSVLCRTVAATVALVFPLATPPILAQTRAADSTHISRAPVPHPHYKLRFALGFVSSIIAHESGHVIASYAVGGHPTFGFNHWLPTIYFGIDSRLDPHKQCIFRRPAIPAPKPVDNSPLTHPPASGRPADPSYRGMASR